MSFQLAYNAAEKIIEMKFQGVYVVEMVDSIAPELIRLIHEKNCMRLLIDFREVEVEVSTLNIYNAPAKLAKGFGTFGVNIHNLKRAMLIKSPREETRFFETVSQNQFQQLRLFFDEQEARKWLLAG